MLSAAVFALLMLITTILVQTFLIAAALLLIGAARKWDTFDDGALMTWAYVAGLAGGALALLALYRSCERPRAGASP